jgi:glutamyl-tRNA reductase
MNLFCVGLSHHTVTVEALEQFTGYEETHALLRTAGCGEALLLNTCNRVEVYAAAGGVVPTVEVARCLARNFDQSNEPARGFYRHEATDCVRHLFRVASGIDSMVVGETEILGQAKKAYEAARSSGTAGACLHRLFQRAFRVAKQVRTHTNITRGSVSVGSVAVDLASKIFGDLAARKVLVIGAGETSEKTARVLVSRGVRDLRVSNRSAERAQELAALVGGASIPFAQWTRQCSEIDILITSTSSETPLLHPANLLPILRERVDRPLFIIDIAVPRNVHPDVNQLEGVFLYDIDSLQSVAAQSLALRRQQINSAEAIISEHVSDKVGVMAEKIVLGTRGSELALAQAHLVENALRARWPDLEIETKTIKTSGDQSKGDFGIVDLRAGRKGLFTGEIERALVRREIDLAVHSAKDLPSAPAPGTQIAGVLSRASVADVLVAPVAYELESLPVAGIVATGSVRRRHQLHWKRPDLKVVDVRGNVPTRLRKLAASAWHAMILARAGLERLGMEGVFIVYEGKEFSAHPLAVEIFTPAGGQGIIAMQTRVGDEKAERLVEAINDFETSLCLRAEREFLRLLEGDCNQPVGVLASVREGLMKIHGQVFDLEATTPREAIVEGASDDAEALAAKLFQKINGSEE